jgi:hypothetical protein
MAKTVSRPLLDITTTPSTPSLVATVSLIIGSLDFLHCWCHLARARAGSARRNRPEACGSQRQHAAPQRSVVSCEPLPRFFAVH